MDSATRKRLKSEGQRIHASIYIGKGGLTDGVKAELDAQLKRDHLVKVRVQRGAAGGDRETEADIAKELADTLGAELVERRGHTVLLYRRRKGR